MENEEREMSNPGPGSIRISQGKDENNNKDLRFTHQERIQGQNNTYKIRVAHIRAFRT